MKSESFSTSACIRGGIRLPALAVVLTSGLAAADLTQHQVDQLVDEVAGLGAGYSIGRPLDVAALLRVTPDGAEGGARVGWTAFRAGTEFLHVRLGQLDWQFFERGGPPELAVATDLVHVDDGYLCHDADGLHFVPPWNLTGPSCGPEWLGYYGELLSFRYHPAPHQTSARFAAAGVLFNLAHTGRTEAVERNIALLRVGLAWEGAAYAGMSDMPVRAEISTRLGIGTDDRRFRVALEGAWRPRLGIWDDQAADGALSVTAFFSISRYHLLAFSARGGLAFGNRPWETTSTWADVTQRWSALTELRLEIYGAG
jgi:hypothetical protein